MFGQPKNNLAAKVPYVLRYHIEGAMVGHDAEEDLPIYGSRIVWDGGRGRNPRHRDQARGP